MSVFLKSASFVSFTDKNFKCLTEIKILSVRMSDTKTQDVLHRTRTCLTENYPVWHDVSFCQTECLTSFKSFQEVWNVLIFFLRSGLKSVIIIISFKSSLHENKWTDKWRQRPSIQWTDWALWFCQLSLWENKYTCLLTILQNLNNESGVFSAPDPIVDFSHFRLLLRNHWNSTTLPRSKIF